MPIIAASPRPSFCTLPPAQCDASRHVIGIKEIDSTNSQEGDVIARKKVFIIGAGPEWAGYRQRTSAMDFHGIRLDHGV